MKVIHFLALLSLSALLCACAAIKGGTDVDGRNVLLAATKAAASYFKEAKKQTPATYGTELRRELGAIWVDHNTSPGLCSSPSDFRKALSGTRATTSPGFTCLTLYR
jgi:hypothetical protein